MQVDHQFLTDCRIKVVVDGACSEVKSVNAGVPQGCVLSPTLFRISGQYFMPRYPLQHYKARVSPHMEYYSHLWAGAPKHQLLPLVSLIDS